VRDWVALWEVFDRLPLVPPAVPGAGSTVGIVADAEESPQNVRHDDLHKVCEH
jgi:hypothetical protein